MCQTGFFSADTLEIHNTEIDPVNDLHIVEWLLCSGRYKEIRCVGCVCKPTREFLRCVVRGEKRSNTRWIVDLSNK